MTRTSQRTELSPLESIILERTLTDIGRRGPAGPLARVQRLTRERQRLYAECAEHPLLALDIVGQIQAISREIELQWQALRCERAGRRVRIERALRIVDRDTEDTEDIEACLTSGASLDAPRRIDGAA